MFRKIHSNRDPKDTVLSELKKEFGKYYSILRQLGQDTARAHPKKIFGLMIISLAISMPLCFSIMRHREPPRKVKALNPLNRGFDQILKAGSDLKEIIGLKKHIDSLAAKQALSRQDSLQLDLDLDKLHQLNKQFSHEH